MFSDRIYCTGYPIGCLKSVFIPTGCLSVKRSSNKDETAKNLFRAGKTMEKLNLNRSGSVPSGVLRTNFKPKAMVSAPMDSIRSEETMEKLNLNRSGSVPSGVLRTNFKPKTMTFWSLYFLLPFSESHSIIKGYNLEITDVVGEGELEFPYWPERINRFDKIGSPSADCIGAARSLVNARVVGVEHLHFRLRNALEGTLMISPLGL
ncbi:hypothetical protein LR48_Vigan233s000500 [Vigna angularis]|uniref:Uncharacterized protein n=1 Tax=Phaseolus angularis TaxID=3914 RepID=A0A0L9T6D2_PHAAN|nr:hypothetical protein LR48_Vigan233s000500 [Vigna angularis]